MNKPLFLFFLSNLILFGYIGVGFGQARQDVHYSVPPNGRLIEAMLKELGARQVPIQEKAAVAEMVEQLPDSITYHCTVCGKDTIHKRPQTVIRSSMWPISHLKHDREQVSALGKFTKLEFFLDEEGFCNNCTRGKLRDRPRLIIVIDRHESINDLLENDLRILDAFFKRKDDVDIQRGTNYQSEPLRNHIPRLRRLLISR
jgi:hypothetical protein